jgi:3-deoxy-manno-octulosonate cytidylyltransferase (CMP-KDO synthetase)
MKKIIVIPARYASTRLPGKPLIDIGGKSLLQRVYEGARRSKLSDSTLIATDDERIKKAALAFGAEVIMTDPALPSGTDRVFAAIQGRKADLVVNLQGDEPFIESSIIDQLFSTMENGDVAIATLCCPITDEHEYRDPNTVKVVLDHAGFALYFSRSPIPYLKTPNFSTLRSSNSTATEDGKFQIPNVVYKHIGIYGFTRSFLQQFVAMPKSPLEEAESLEQLRVLENGYRIRVLATDYNGFGIDTEADLLRAEERLRMKS